MPQNSSNSKTAVMMIPFPYQITSNFQALILFLLVTTSTSSISYKNNKFTCFESIISIGDSLSDTGNLILLDTPTLLPAASAYPPYGRTFFNHPTGRFSDGRLVIDFIAESLDLPFLKPYLEGRNDDFSESGFAKGVNFAVAGATALDLQFFEDRGMVNPLTNVSLKDELVWFNQFLATVPDPRKFLETSLILFLIGGNDYNYPLTEGKSIEETKSVVPKVINKMGNTIEEVIKLGVRTMLVPGNFPLGCVPLYLTKFKTSNSKDYDSKTGCINWLNELSRYQNLLLQDELNRIQNLHPDVTIIYGDYYNSVMRFYNSPSEFGFTKEVLRACCGHGGLYNFNSSTVCGLSNVHCCEDPSSFASWDGIHFTEAVYKLLAQSLLQGPYTTPRFSSVCTSTAPVHGLLRNSK